MTIGALVCRSGVGPNASIGLFVTHGLISGAAPITATSLSIGGPNRKKLAKNDYDRPYLSDHAEALNVKKMRIEEEEFFILN